MGRDSVKGIDSLKIDSGNSGNWSFEYGDDKEFNPSAIKRWIKLCEARRRKIN